ncbi:hypothetical protein BU15DRAFT_69366, partial [Melanogaster broomeanus]
MNLAPISYLTTPPPPWSMQSHAVTTRTSIPASQSPKEVFQNPAQGGYQLRERLNWIRIPIGKFRIWSTPCVSNTSIERSWPTKFLQYKTNFAMRMVARYDPDNLLNLSVQLLTTHLLFVTNKATLTERWANTSVVVSEPTQASVILVAPERRGHHRRVAWLLLKSASATLVRSLNYTQEENLTGLSPIFADEEQSALMLRIGQRTHRLMFENSGLFYCFLLKSKPSLTDLYYPRVLSEDSLLQAWETYHIISDFPRMLQGQPVQLDEEQTGLSTVAHPQFDTLSDAATNPTIAVMLNEEEAGLATG